MLALTAALAGLGSAAAGQAPGAAGRRWLLGGWFGLGLAFAVKGPSYPALLAAVLVADAALRRELGPAWQRLEPHWGIPFAATIGLAPLLAVASRAGGETIVDFFGHHNLERAVRPLHGHGGPVVYYLPVLLLGLAPFTPFLVRPLVGALGRSPEGEERNRFLALWAVAVVAVFSMLATKLPHYVAGIVPALALLAAGSRLRPGRREWNLVVWLALPMGLAIASLPVALRVVVPKWLDEATIRRAPELSLPLPGDPLASTAFVLSGLLLAAGAFAARRRALEGEEASRALRMLGASAVLSWCLLGIAAGRVLDAASLAPVTRLARTASEALPPGGAIQMLGMTHRAGAGVATGRRLVFWRLRDGEEVARLAGLLAGPGPVRAIVPAGRWRELGGRVTGRAIAADRAWLLLGEAPPQSEPNREPTESTKPKSGASPESPPS